MTPVTGVLIRILADTPVDPTTGRGPEWGKAAPVALLIIVLMGIALFVLIKSMNKQLRKVPNAFTDPSDNGRRARGAAAHADPNPVGDTEPEDAQQADGEQGPDADGVDRPQ